MHRFVLCAFLAISLGRFALAAKGLVEGYPDGTFKGDRAASRWELAMVVARLLRSMEQSHATFASRAELEEIRKLTQVLSDELEALGVRVTQLEEQTLRLDKRVTELERVTFYGSLESRVVMQSFSNSGSGDNDSLRNGGGNASNVPFINYHDAVGSALGATRRPQLHAAIPVVDFSNGRGLTNGTGFTARAILGLKIKISDQLDAGAEFSAFSSQGDRNVDAYWGVSAPYLSNIFTGNASAGGAGQALTNQPYTRMNLDKFWLHHKPSDTRLVLGEIVKTEMDPLVFAGQPNLGVFGPRRWAGYGFDVSGNIFKDEQSRLRWEVLGTRFGNGNVFLADNYQNYVLAGNLAYEFHKNAGKVQANFARLAEEASSRAPLVVGGFGPGGGTTGINVAYGNSAGWTVRQWVNPPGYFAAQQSAFNQTNSGQLAVVLNTVDQRPISGWNGAADNAVGFAVGGGGGNYGPQSQDTFGLTARYRWKLGQGEKTVTLMGKAEWGHSRYRPNRNSAYSSDGDALRLELESALLEERLLLGAEYLSVDPDYNPAAFFGNALGVRFPRSMNFTGVWHHHDFIKYPHNREGFRLRADWKFLAGNGRLWGKASFLDQKRTSLYDVRVLPGALGSGSPNFPVLGFSPGFVDPVFSGFAHPNVYGTASGNSFTSGLVPIENPRGSEDSYQVGASYRWPDAGVRLSGSYGHTDFERFTRLSPGLGGDQNHVDVAVDFFNVDVDWQVDPKWKVNAGVDYTRSAGHFDPGGLYHSYAVATGSSTFNNLDSTQVSPYLGVEHSLSEKATWGLGVRRYLTTDGVSSTVRAGGALDAAGSSAHPFEWDGWQISSHYQLHFEPPSRMRLQG